MKKIIYIILVISLLASHAMAVDPDVLKGVNAAGQTLIGIKVPAAVNVYVLVANTGQTITKPTAANYMLPSCTADTWFLWGGTAAVTAPTANITDGSGPELNPGAIRNIDDISTIGIVSAVGGTCSISFFK